MRAAKLGAIRFRSRSAKVRFYLKNTSLSQTLIARKCRVSIPCVNQVLAAAVGLDSLRV